LIVKVQLLQKLDYSSTTCETKICTLYYSCQCTSYWWSSNPFKCYTLCLEQETLPSYLSTSWFQEQIQGWYHNKAGQHLC